MLLSPSRQYYLDPKPLDQPKPTIFCLLELVRRGSVEDWLDERRLMESSHPHHKTIYAGQTIPVKYSHVPCQMVCQIAMLNPRRRDVARTYERNEAHVIQDDERDGSV